MKKLPCILLLLAITACVKEVDLTVGDRQVAVECILRNEFPQTLRLFLTSGTSGIEPQALRRSLATLTDLADPSTAMVFEWTGDEVLTLYYAALPGHSYRLEVEVPGYGIVRAEDTLPDAFEINYLFSPGGIKLSKSDSSYFYHHVGNPKGEQYMTPFGGVFFQTSSLPEHVIIQAYAYDIETDDHIMSETIFSDCPGTDERNLDGSVYQAPASYYDGEGVEILYMYNAKLDGSSCHRGFLKIDKDKALSQNFFTISASNLVPRAINPDLTHYIWGYIPGSPVFFQGIVPVYWEPMPRMSDYFRFTALSDNYNAYLDDALSQKDLSSDLASIYIREESFSNIEGGVGILGSAVSIKLPAYVDETIMEEKIKTGYAGVY